MGDDKLAVLELTMNGSQLVHPALSGENYCPSKERLETQ